LGPTKITAVAHSTPHTTPTGPTHRFMEQASHPTAGDQ
jgi:hypothetical protein